MNNFEFTILLVHNIMVYRLFSYIIIVAQYELFYDQCDVSGILKLTRKNWLKDELIINYKNVMFSNIHRFPNRYSKDNNNSNPNCNIGILRIRIIYA